MNFAFLTTLPEESGLDIMEFFTLYLLIYGFVLLVCLATYILQSVSLYTIAKRRCIKKPWLAWLPIGYNWLLGSVSDQYRYVTKGQVKNKRKALLTLDIIAAGLGIVCIVLLGKFIFQAVEYTMYIDTMLYVDTALEMQMAVTFLGMMGVTLLLSGVGIASAVICYMADYDLYRSCEPGNAVLYLVLSIFFGITRPIFMLICCKKDGGMPPRKQEPVAAIPAQPVQEPWEKPAEE